ncbi:MAG: sulfotransferase [Acidobacteria bacterium]|nr:sulfotransferase [Acidobacteriota bacterium]
MRSRIDEPRFLFVLTQPYSGSTALARVLSTASGAALLHPSGEGQWLVPEMSDAARWDPAKVMDWAAIRAAWLARIDELCQTTPVTVVIEKSPPNLVRIDQLMRVFPNHLLMALTRHPLAQCASVLVRHHAPEQKTPDERVEIVRRLADIWLERARWMQHWIGQFDVTRCSYEAFCARPAACIEALTPGAPEFATVDVHATFDVKDYPRQGLLDQNRRQIEMLTSLERDAIAQQLGRDAALVSFFGYDVG